MQDMIGYKCEKCGKVHYPKHTRCINCRNSSFKEVELGKECNLLTYTKLWATPEGIDQVPLVLGIVEFENGARATGQITTQDVELGMKLKPIWGFLRRARGQEIYGFKFEPIK